MVSYHAMKRNNKSTRKTLKIIITLLIIATVAIGAWKARHIFNFSDTDLGKMFEKKPTTAEKSIYNIYQTKIQKAAGNVYYVKFTEVVCDAAADYDGTPHYFKVDITFETNTLNDAERLAHSKEEVTAALRSVMKDLRLRDYNGRRIMEYTKDHTFTATEKIVGKGAVKGVYFESFLSQ